MSAGGQLTAHVKKTTGAGTATTASTAGGTATQFQRLQGASDDSNSNSHSKSSNSNNNRNRGRNSINATATTLPLSRKDEGLGSICFSFQIVSQCPCLSFSFTAHPCSQRSNHATINFSVSAHNYQARALSKLVRFYPAVADGWRRSRDGAAVARKGGPSTKRRRRLAVRLAVDVSSGRTSSRISTTC